MAIGVGELLAGLFTGVPSPLAAIGGAVVEGAPSWLEDFAIATFGTGDKAALAIGTAVVAGIVGWLAGTLGRTRPWLVPVAFGLFGVLGIAAARNEPGAEFVAIVAATLVAVSAGLLTHRLLVPRIEEPPMVSPPTVRGDDSSGWPVPREWWRSLLASSDGGC